jgi:hypothetical protein
MIYVDKIYSIQKGREMTQEEYDVMSNLDSCRQVYGILSKWQGDRPEHISTVIKTMETEIDYLKKKLDVIRGSKSLVEK